LPEDQDNNDPLEEGAEDTGTLDSDNTQTISFTPSTMGMSFRVDPGATHIKVTVGWGHYQRVGSESLTNEKTGNPKPIWRRTPRGGSYLLPLRDGRSEPWHPEATEQPEVELRAIIRRTDACWMVSLFLINGQERPQKLVDRTYLFQPELRVEAADSGPIFQSGLQSPQSQQSQQGQQGQQGQRARKAEDQAMAMLYRHHVSFAMGTASAYTPRRQQTIPRVHYGSQPASSRTTMFQPPKRPRSTSYRRSTGCAWICARWPRPTAQHEQRQGEK
jgi:hypothetical protein